jgi:hypothetical protein
VKILHSFLLMFVKSCDVGLLDETLHKTRHRHLSPWCNPPRNTRHRASSHSTAQLGWSSKVANINREQRKQLQDADTNRRSHNYNAKTSMFAKKLL